MARYLLRSGKYADVDAHPNHLDVVTFRNQSGEFIYALLSEDAERDLLSLQWRVQAFVLPSVDALFKHEDLSGWR